MALTITAISDTHNLHERLELPGGDILIHSGDATSRGSVAEMADFLKWFGAQDYSHRIFVPGNHDWIAESNPNEVRKLAKLYGVIILIDEGYEAEGIKIWGSPVQPWFYDWAFNRKRGDAIKKHWDLIPTDTEILITHGPAYGVLDKTVRTKDSVGCEELNIRIQEIPSIKMHTCGHIHEARGNKTIEGRLFVNASSLTAGYDLASPLGVQITKDNDSGLYRVEI